MKIYKVICSCGWVTHDVYHGLSYDEALDFCNEHNWEYDWNGGLVWDLDIVEDGWEVYATT